MIEIDQAVARTFAELRADLFDIGRPTPEMDLLIAATAITHGLTVITHNTKDYAHVPGIQLDDWIGP